MKKLPGLILIFLLFAFKVYPQAEKEVFSESEIVWFGLDFSKAKLVGSEGFSDPQEIQNKYFDSWNQVILKESDKYDIKKAFNKSNIIYDLTIVEKRNARVNTSELVINKDFTLERSVVDKVIKEYAPEQKKGVGLVFIVESFNKFRETGSVYVTFFDLSSKKVLVAEKMSGKAGGFGVRNYWARAIYNILRESEATYKTWAKK